MANTEGAVPTDAKKVLQVNEGKWSKALMASGWTAFPSIVLEHQAELKLNALDLNILVYLSTHWWTADNKPRPSKSTVAAAIGVSPRTVQRRISQMQARGLLKREERRLKGKGSKPNRYHFDGLIKAAQPFAAAKTAEIARKMAKKSAPKGKPHLQLVK